MPGLAGQKLKRLSNRASIADQSVENSTMTSSVCSIPAEFSPTERYASDASTTASPSTLDSKNNATGVRPFLLSMKDEDSLNEGCSAFQDQLEVKTYVESIQESVIRESLEESSCSGGLTAP